MIRLLFLLLPFLSFGQFYKYSTIYGGVSTQSTIAPIETYQYINNELIEKNNSLVEEYTLQSFDQKYLQLIKANNKNNLLKQDFQKNYENMRIYKTNLENHPRGPRSSDKKKAVMIGATGATGKQLLRQLLDSDQWVKITSVSRKPVLNGKGHEKLNEIIVESFDGLSSTADDWTDHDVFFNCIGTTRKIAGGAKQFVDVDWY